MHPEPHQPHIHTYYLALAPYQPHPHTYYHNPIPHMPGHLHTTANTNQEGKTSEQNDEKNEKNEKNSSAGHRKEKYVWGRRHRVRRV